MKVPISKGAICPNYDGPLQVLVLFVFVFTRPKQNASAPIVANCPTCRTCFINEHLLKQTTIKLMTSIGIQLEILNPTEIENLINALDPLPFLDAQSNIFIVDSIVLTLTLLRYQSHSWAHLKSCFKKSAHTTFKIVCCFAFPQSTTLVIVVNVDFKIIPQCRIGNKNINGYFPVVATTFKCNHPICCLIGGDRHDVTYYIMKYTTKNHNEFENLVAIHLSAFKK